MHPFKIAAPVPYYRMTKILPVPPIAASQDSPNKLARVTIKCVVCLCPIMIEHYLVSSKYVSTHARPGLRDRCNSFLRRIVEIVGGDESWHACLGNDLLSHLHIGPFQSYYQWHVHSNLSTFNVMNNGTFRYRKRRPHFRDLFSATPNESLISSLSVKDSTI